MNLASSFKVYNASAGSGKTFTLVKEYLKVILKSESNYAFQQILAITFTNKAAAEMKERVLHNLKSFADGDPSDMLNTIEKELYLEIAVIQERSAKILETILQNYAAFNITTIDSFTHKIIKSFAFDLGLNVNFDVELDTQTLLSQAVDVLVAKIGIDQEVTNALVNFSLEKINEDKSWDISKDLNEFAKVLLNEDDIPYFKKLSKKTLDDFIFLKNKLVSANKKIEQGFLNIGNQGLEMISQKGLQFSDFAYSGELPKHFVKLTNYKYLKFSDLKFEGRLEKTISEGKKLVAAKASESSKQQIELIQNDLIALYEKSKEYFSETNQVYTLNSLVLKSIIPLAVLTKINHELTSIKEENNTLLISEFNQLISKSVKNQPAPFIYEQIGQKFKHYFIDEMQDTSVLQWENLIPLIDNALAQEKSNLLLVGDGKQAIYRWRGGKAEQFIFLGDENNTEKQGNPFHIVKKVNELETNFRSYSEIINFNNCFFQFASRYIENNQYKQLYIDGNKQKTTNKIGGYVSIDFLNKLDDADENKLRYAQKVYDIIVDLPKDFSRSDICILVRKKSEALVVANYLSEREVDLVSSETLLLQNSSKVNFIVNFLQLTLHPNDQETLLNVLYFIYGHLSINEDQQQFFEKFINNHEKTFFEEIRTYGVHFELLKFHQLPLYEKIEEIIRVCFLTSNSDAYLQFFLDVVFEQQQKGLDVQEFLDFWNIKKTTLSIVAPEVSNAVQIMTIHKSKGLEFPVVIFPYDIDFYFQKDPKSWVGNLPLEYYDGFDSLLVSSFEAIKNIGNEGEIIYQNQREALELDNYNLLYVALTRAVEQLYIVADNKMSSKGIPNTNYSSGVLIEFLKNIDLWDDSKTHYVFGSNQRVSKKSSNNNLSITQQKFVSNSWKNHQIYLVANSSKLWETNQEKAIEYGNLLHEILSKIKSSKEVDSVIELYKQNGFLINNNPKKIKKLIEQVVNHTELKQYFSENLQVYTEREIVSSSNELIIPDRLNFVSKNELVLIDYKTGNPVSQHQQQVINYEHVLVTLGYKVVKKILVYIGECVELVEV